MRIRKKDNIKVQFKMRLICNAALLPKMHCGSR